MIPSPIMDRAQFEALRDIPDKVIRGDIRLAARKQTHPELTAEIIVENSSNTELRMQVKYNPETGCKGFNVVAVGVGPICRLDIDGPVHGDAGRCHKHSLQTERCPDQNLRKNVAPRADLSGRSLADLFAIFCEMANIKHEGMLYPPST